MGSAESAGGRLGAVLSAPRTGAVALGPHGPWLATTPGLAKRVLTDPASFDFPGDVSRSGDLSGSTGDTRSGHTVFAPLAAEDVARGRAVFGDEWRAALLAHDRSEPATPYDAMALLRRPVARSTAAAVLPGLATPERDLVADLVLAWVDALGPVIAARRPPHRWSRARRAERVTRVALEDALDPVADRDRSATQLATMLAAGTQVPVAAGAWLIAWLAQHPSEAPGETVDPVHAVWETLRLTPPTWVTARITTADVDLDGQLVPQGRVVLVSPLLLGRSEELVPGDGERLADFDPARWTDPDRRPGAWLPFGAGPHACPGRTLGLAQLVHVAQWASAQEIALVEDVSVDQSRGILPSPCRFTLAPRRGPSP
ncbi:cytochrome P450 [Nocardioides renjunii]|uniref:cytochrome P450 n=1 Tax=Nocardioides renjunii TaxID=3095075 RepID=UPI002AFFEB1D|nr:cytochrome P450 [Nocardioides sp. S-34]WQQ21869.1 cytochrome P450 [Nocardioides sp. S-34]